MSITKPVFVSNEQVIGFDCDDTLILHRLPVEGEETIDIVDPYDNTTSRYVIHKPHIKLMRDRLQRGCAVIMWSQNGPQWAKAVADALNLQPTLICAKPFMIVDDLPPTAWMPSNVYMKPETVYGSGQLQISEEKVG